ncbi:MAG: hypothetical protein EOO03_01025 [Chitinophagaceae bacterium]|nr:MAG: hypothetical protein EOO03_01025 [Chitinophagaceae bacterium]
MTGTFKANNPSNNFLLLLYGLVLKMPIFLHPRLPELEPADGPLYSAFLIWGRGIFTNAPIFFSILSFILLYVQAVVFNKVVNDQRMFHRPTYLVGMSYLLISSLFSDWFAFSSSLIASTIFIWVWSKLCTMHNNNTAKTTIYNIGLSIGLACFFYYPAIIFTILFMVGIAITRPFKLNEWLIGLIGIATCFYFFASWIFLSGQWNTYRPPWAMVTSPVFENYRWAIGALVLITLTAMLGIYFIQGNMRRQLVQTRKSWQLMYLYLLCSVLVPFVNSGGQFGNWILMAIPVSMLISGAFFYPDKKWFPLLIHWSMVGIAVAVGHFI